VTYTIKQVAELSGVSAYRIRYYDQQKMIPNLRRDENNNRVFDEDALDIVRLISCFRETDMPLADIRHYIDLLAAGETTRPERLAIMASHKRAIEDETSLLQNNLAIVNQKMADMQAGRYV